MILTGSQIELDCKEGNIVLEPFDSTALNPNSYNYRLGETIKVFDYFDAAAQKSVFRELVIPEFGIVLTPHQMYLGHTLEVIGSKKYAMSLIGRSSLGRLGLFVQVSANLGHTTSSHRWTLEIVATQPIRLYKNMTFGQVSFWHNEGDILPTPAHYAPHNQPLESSMSQERL